MRGISTLITFLLSCALYAQTDSLLHEVRITAQRRLSETGVQRTTLDTTILHQNVALSMSDVLTQHSSLFIKSYGRATESTAEFRGTSPSHTQVLWNGLRINSPMLGTVDFSTIPAYFVDEANLLHGASSLTLTGGGLGGAVDLCTQPVRKRGWGVQYIQGIGSYDTYDQFLRLTYGGQCWTSSTRVVYATSNNRFHYTNYNKKIDERDDAGNIIRSYHPRELNRSGYFHDFHALQEFSLRPASIPGALATAAVWFTHSLRGLPFLSVDYRDDSDFRNEQLQDAVRSVISWQQPLGSSASLDARAGYTYQSIAYDYATKSHTPSSSSSTPVDGASSAVSSPSFTTITDSHTYSQLAYLQGKIDYSPAANWLLTANLSLTYNHVRSRDQSPFHIGDNYNEGRLESSLSLSAKYRPTSRLALSAILREELYRRDLVPLIPALFGEYTLLTTATHSGRTAGLYLKASIARNYRYPTMDDLYFKPGGNPDLRPERGFTYDGGLEGHLQLPLGRRDLSLVIRGNLSAFNSYITDWILWTPNAKGYWQPSNLKKVHNYGTELSLTSELHLPHDWHFALTANYAYTPSLNQSEDLDAADASYGKQLVYVPLHSANLSARLRWRTWGLAYQWYSYSERFTTTSNEVGYITGRLKPYYMSDLTFEKQFRWRRFQASIKAAIYNLFDSEYVTVLSRPMAGRHFEIFLEICPL